MPLHHLINSNYQAVLNENNEIEITDSYALSTPENISKLLVENGLPTKTSVSVYRRFRNVFFKNHQN